ncbi:MAG: proteasome accessory factor PafA2 family protein [Nitrospiria bacterium]
MTRLFGIETEYGIIREDVETSDPVVESMELVRRHHRPFRADWDYGGEDPKQDARGFRAKMLQQEEEELEFEEKDRHRPFSFHEMKSDLMLANGARFYNDHTHPEYSTPECGTLLSLIAHDRAGERILLDCARKRSRMLGVPGAVQLYKNNTDFHGHSYGCHDNYLVPRHVPFADLATSLVPFLVTRQIFAGAGKVGVENCDGYKQEGFQLSQRADFIEVETSIDTMHARPILNTRDEPHADQAHYRRLHLIIGDANMSEFATALKVGTTALVLELIARGLAPKAAELSEPVAAVRTLSHAIDLKHLLRLSGGRRMFAVDHQRLYLDAAKNTFASADGETRWILENWETTLDALESDPMRLADRLDWVAKKWLLETFIEAEGTDWRDTRLLGLDLEYHNIDPERGLFLGLEMEGAVHRFVSDEAVRTAMETPPSETRAGVRGMIVSKFLKEIYKIQWERIVFKGGMTKRVYAMDRLFEPRAVRQEIERIRQCRTVDELIGV